MPNDHYNWGGSAMLLTAANFLQRDYVIGQPSDIPHPWNCCLYRPSSMSKAKKVIETGEQLILTVSECVEMIATAERADPINFPLTLRYIDRHYSAYIHCTLPGPHDSGVLADDGSSEIMDISQDEISDDVMKGEDDGLAGVLGAASRSPGESDINEFVVPVSRTYRVPSEYGGSQLCGLPAPLNDEKSSADQPGGNSAAATGLIQWQFSAAEWAALYDVRVGNTELQQLQGPGPSTKIRKNILADGSADTVLHNCYQDCHRRVQALVEQSGDSGHTSLVIRHQSTILVTQRGQRAKQPVPRDGGRSSTLHIEGARSRQDMWQEFESEWLRTALSGFPTVGSSYINWNKVAQMELRRLLTMVRCFPYNSQLLQVLSDETLVAWSAVWRQECMYDRLAVYRDRMA
ncbi:hypothetical protein CCR75_000057 [Bremia lactucae]|uniref:Uncharacterized protein n=1 Tax=Bremia lactucae TaxID=4779 RepID=A0A976FI28_BRELC|nr:hypothetical protein CCR75_000057 [Bremia lactucae]